MPLTRAHVGKCSRRGVVLIAVIVSMLVWTTARAHRSRLRAMPCTYQSESPPLARAVAIKTANFLGAPCTLQVEVWDFDEGRQSTLTPEDHEMHSWESPVLHGNTLAIIDSYTGTVYIYDVTGARFRQVKTIEPQDGPAWEGDWDEDEVCSDRVFSRNACQETDKAGTRKPLCAAVALFMVVRVVCSLLRLECYSCERSNSGVDPATLCQASLVQMERPHQCTPTHGTQTATPDPAQHIFPRPSVAQHMQDRSWDYVSLSAGYVAVSSEDEGRVHVFSRETWEVVRSFDMDWSDIELHASYMLSIAQGGMDVIDIASGDSIQRVSVPGIRLGQGVSESRKELSVVWSADGEHHGERPCAILVSVFSIGTGIGSVAKRTIPLYPALDGDGFLECPECVYVTFVGDTAVLWHVPGEEQLRYLDWSDFSRTGKVACSDVSELLTGVGPRVQELYELARPVVANSRRIFAGYEVMREEYYRNPSYKKRFQGRPVSVLRMLTASEDLVPQTKGAS